MYNPTIPPTLFTTNRLALNLIKSCDGIAEKLSDDLASDLTSIISRMEEQNTARKEKMGKGGTPRASPDDKVKDCQTWDVYNSFFFSFTAITTIGYGRIYPETQG